MLWDYDLQVMFINIIDAMLPLLVMFNCESMYVFISATSYFA